MWLKRAKAKIKKENSFNKIKIIQNLKKYYFKSKRAKTKFLKQRKRERPQGHPSYRRMWQLTQALLVFPRPRPLLGPTPRNGLLPGSGGCALVLFSSSIFQILFSFEFEFKNKNRYQFLNFFLSYFWLYFYCLTFDFFK